MTRAIFVESLGNLSMVGPSCVAIKTSHVRSAQCCRFFAVVAHIAKWGAMARMSGNAWMVVDSLWLRVKVVRMGLSSALSIWRW